MTGLLEPRYAVVVLIPVYNDWAAVSLVIAELDRVMHELDYDVSVLLVDDGSSELVAHSLDGVTLTAITEVTQLPLRRNLGHQRAIAIGLAHIESSISCDAVVVMDGDGEDKPEDVPRLLQKCQALGNTSIVFAERARRVDRLSFRVLYACYRLAHWILVGMRVRVGNFSAIPNRLLRRLVVVSELWNHYAAAVFAAKLPRSAIETARGRRLRGNPKMNFVTLVAHGLSAISVHSEALAVRLLVGSMFGSAVLVSGVAVAAWVAVGSGASVSTAVVAGTIVALVILAELVVLALMLAFRTLQGRASSAFLPVRDYRYYVETPITLRRRVDIAVPVLPSR
jgi:hypothetical protein